MRRLTLLALLLFVPLAMMGGCKKGPTSSKPKVIATFSVLGDLVTNVAGDKVEVVTLVGPDSDTHSYELTPQDVTKIADAVAIFEVGVGLEQWLNSLYKSSNSKAKRQVVSKGVALQAGADDDHDKKDHKDHKHDPKDEDKDPHIWHDVKNAIIMVGLIRDMLVEVDPKNAEHYKTRAKDYTKKLEDLDIWVVKEVDKLPKDRRKLVTNHDTFGYFAKRYGFEIVGDALGSTSTDVKELSAQEKAKLIEKIKAAKVPVIFAENIESSKHITQLAKDAGVRIGPELYTDALGKSGSAGETYEKMINHNVTTIVTELLKQ